MKQHDDLDSWKTSRRSPVQAARSQIVSRVVCGKVPPPTPRATRESSAVALIWWFVGSYRSVRPN